MLSRHADACYWIGRCVERAEATARALDVHYHAALESLLPASVDDPEDSGALSPWKAVLAVTGSAHAFEPRYKLASDRNVLQFFVLDRENSNSIFSIWSAARENARTVREMIASEMWECLNVSYLQLQEWTLDRVLDGSPHEFFQSVQNASHLFQGVLDRTLLFDETRDWLDVGRFLERGGQTARLLDIKYHQLLPATRSADPGSVSPETYGIGGPLDIQGWIAVLRSVSAFEMFRKRHRDGFRPPAIVDFLVLGPAFPASIRHCVDRVGQCLQRISGSASEEPAGESERLIGRLQADLTYARPEEIIIGGLHEFALDVQSRCAQIGSAITHEYFSY